VERPVHGRSRPPFPIKPGGRPGRVAIDQTGSQFSTSHFSSISASSSGEIRLVIG
jgi:hypothetical protein